MQLRRERLPSLDETPLHSYTLCGVSPAHTVEQLEFSEHAAGLFWAQPRKPCYCRQVTIATQWQRVTHSARPRAIAMITTITPFTSSAPVKTKKRRRVVQASKLACFLHVGDEHCVVVAHQLVTPRRRCRGDGARYRAYLPAQLRSVPSRAEIGYPLLMHKLGKQYAGITSCVIYVRMSQDRAG